MLKKNVVLMSVLLMSFAAEGLAAKVFSWRESDGQRHYSDSAPAGSGAKEMLLAERVLYSVTKIYDGDTVLLDNHLKVRLLSINTPELERYNKLGEAGGERARERLRRLLSGQKVRLEKDLESQDKYGRTLGHIFTAAGVHINLEMVKSGWATVNIHPPNVKYSQAMLTAQQEAQALHLGLWGMGDYQPKRIVAALEKRHYGWQRLIGTIHSAQMKRKYVYLGVDVDKLMVRIPRANLSFFADVMTYIGKEVEIRGWVSRRGKMRSVLVRHPSALLVR
jgi:micrococcal nuclease